MTPEELKAWRIEVCTNLANGVKYQMKGQLMGRPGWSNVSAGATAAEVFADPDNRLFEIRIKPKPRKVWIGWHRGGYPILTTTDPALGTGDESWQADKWQLVEEQV